MRILIVLVFLFSSMNVFSQVKDTCVCLPKKSWVNIAHDIKELDRYKYNDSIKSGIIIRQDSTITDQKNLISKDSTIILGQEKIIFLYKENEKSYKGIIEDYKNMAIKEKILYFTYGILPGIIIGSLLLK